MRTQNRGPSARRRWAPPLAMLIALIVTMAVAGTALAAIAFGTAANGQNGAASTLNITKPASTAAGDFLLAQITFEKGSDAGLTGPSGWTLIRRTDRSTDLGQAIYYKFATASEPASYSWGFSQTVKAAGGILRYTGVRPVDPVNVSAGNTGDNGSLQAPSVTTTEANTLLVTFFGVKKTTTLTIPSGMTARYTGNYFQNPQDVTILAADEARPSAGATGTRASTAGSVDKWVAQSIALREDGTLAITLASMTATAAADAITVTWDTVSEIDNAGFNLYRDTTDAGPGVKLNAGLIPSQGSGSPEGYHYVYLDSAGLTPNTTYWYWLEDVSTTGVATRHEPISVLYGGEPTALGLAAFGAAALPPAATPSLAGLVALALAALAGIARRR